MTAEPALIGREHWTHKGSVRLFNWERLVEIQEIQMELINEVRGRR